MPRPRAAYLASTIASGAAARDAAIAGVLAESLFTEFRRSSTQLVGGDPRSTDAKALETLPESYPMRASSLTAIASASSRCWGL